MIETRDFDVVTGAFGYTGKYVARRLLAAGRKVRTLTNHPDRPNPFGGQIEVAHSKDIVGAGIVAGGPFACAETESSSLFPYWPVVLWQNATRARTPA